MAHNSKRNRRNTTIQDGDDYVYPAAKIRETKTRDRRSGKNQIQKGLLDHESLEPLNDDNWYDDKPMYTESEIESMMEEFADIADPVDLFGSDDISDLDLSEDFGHEWENY